MGFIWGSSYLFIKLAVDDFGTFTLVALRLIVGAILLWIVIRIAKQPLPRERRIYGHLIVMAIINITIPFLLITWAEQYVESSLAAILTSPVPLFAIVLSAWFLPDEPIRVNGLVGLVVGFVGVVIITSRGPDRRGRVARRASSRCSARPSATRAARSTRDATSAACRRWSPRSSRCRSRRSSRACSRSSPSIRGPPRPTARPIFAILWLGVLGSGLAYLLVFRLFANWGATRTTIVAYVIPVVGIALGYLVLAEPVDARIIFGTALVIAGHRPRQQPVRPAAAVRSRAAGRGRLAPGRRRPVSGR